jgi:hypothetical protein
MSYIKKFTVLSLPKKNFLCMYFLFALNQKKILRPSRSIFFFQNRELLLGRNSTVV